MKLTYVAFVVALAVSPLYGQDIPFGTAGERGLELRPLSHRVTPTRIPVDWSACGSSKVDGVFSPGEWNPTTSHVITVNTSAGAVPATLYVKNDNLTLFIAIKFPESAPHSGSLAIEFDNDNDGVPYEPGDDAIVYNNEVGFFDDFRQACAGGICAPEDKTDGSGSTEGRGAYVNDGTNSVYEISHPFSDSDAGHDFALSCGGIGGVVTCNPVGFFLMLRVVENGTFYDTYYPDVAVYDQITFQECQLSIALGGCGTPSIDGKIGSTEWVFAGGALISVNVTPRGDTAPGTMYLMNDSFNVYLGFALEQAVALPYLQTDLFFDSIEQDSLLFSPTLGFLDMGRVPCPPILGNPPCRNTDTAVGGTNDGAEAFANNGSQTAFEISHPLNSGDGHDVALSYGDTIQFRLSFSMALTPPPVTTSTTNVPVGTWMICTPAPTQSVRELSQQVDALDSSGALSPKNADTLNKDLIKANGNLQSGKLKQAANDLGNFADDVRKMMRKGELADRLGQPLVAAANAAISQL